LSQQSAWDAEDAALFRGKLHELHADLAAAEEAERKARQEYAQARAAREKARAKLTSFIEADCRPTPLTDWGRRQSEEESVNGKGHADPVIEKDLEKVLEAESDEDARRHRLDGLALNRLALPVYFTRRLEGAGLNDIGKLVDFARERGKPLRDALDERFADAGWDPKAPALVHASVLKYLEMNRPAVVNGEASCRSCGCTQDDCSRCIVATGAPCHWYAPDPELCTACAPRPDPKQQLGPKSEDLWHPDPGVAEHQVRGAYIAELFDSSLTSPVYVKPFVMEDGSHWVCTGYARDWYDVAPLIPAKEFAERFPDYPRRVKPAVPDNPTDEQRLQYYTGVRVRVRKSKYHVAGEYCIAPAGDHRKLAATSKGDRT
jgi:hypothetical protein